jgi:alkanesulfonate monooxygenase SsuD/methylene tetrahydromethanopterin reductase-like flavin-dependent oxidoreductase (luciferase family)
MKFAVSYSTPFQGMDPEKLVGYAQHAEACGFEGLYVPEHVTLYRCATFGGVEMPTTLPYADPLDLLAFVAAATDRLLLGTARRRLLPGRRAPSW